MGAALAALALLAGCSRKESYQIMAQQPRCEPLESSAALRTLGCTRAPVPGTVARGHLDADPLLYRGESAGRAAGDLPFALTRAVLDRGHERFDIYCSPCHGRTGDADGMVVRRGFLPPPSLHEPRLREAPVGHFFQVMSQGYGAMPSYAHQVSARDRWAIAAYIRALQLSRRARLADVPPEARAALDAAGATP
jgi:mono/diheme cytochrome c family protein